MQREWESERKENEISKVKCPMERNGPREKQSMFPNVLLLSYVQESLLVKVKTKISCFVGLRAFWHGPTGHSFFIFMVKAPCGAFDGDGKRK
jgi:hypothetical protein